jgi:hypothetical protein
MTTESPERIEISKHSSGYYQVSIPNFEGGEVVRSSDHERIVKELEAAETLKTVELPGQVSDRLSGEDARNANLEHGGGKSIRPLNVSYGPTFSDAIRVAEKLRDEWAERASRSPVSDFDHMADAAIKIIHALESLSPSGTGEETDE